MKMTLSNPDTGTLLEIGKEEFFELKEKANQAREYGHGEFVYAAMRFDFQLFDQIETRLCSANVISCERRAKSDDNTCQHYPGD